MTCDDQYDSRKNLAFFFLEIDSYKPKIPFSHERKTLPMADNTKNSDKIFDRPQVSQFQRF